MAIKNYSSHNVSIQDITRYIDQHNWHIERSDETFVVYKNGKLEVVIPKDKTNDRLVKIAVDAAVQTICGYYEKSPKDVFKSTD